MLRSLLGSLALLAFVAIVAGCLCYPGAAERTIHALADWRPW